MSKITERYQFAENFLMNLRKYFLKKMTKKITKIRYITDLKGRLMFGG